MGKNLTKDNEIINLPDVSPEDAWKRPTKYSEDIPEVLRYHFARGRSKVQIATGLGISTTTLDNWAKQYPEVRDALIDGEQYFEAFWEELAQKAALNEIKINTPTFIWYMCNKIKTYTQKNDGAGTNITINNQSLTLTKEERQARIQQLSNKQQLTVDNEETE